MKTPEEQIKEVMEMTDDMLVEIHKDLVEKVGEESANNWVEMLKKFREKEIENFKQNQNEMDIELVPPHLVLELKQIGFDKDCTSPKFQQAFQWFRDEYDLISAVDSIADENGLRFNYSIEKYGDNWKDIISNSEPYPKYGEAELACLKKLIEIIQIQNDNRRTT
jgi:hypothetical protein